MFDTFIINPVINALLVLYDVLGNNFILAIAVFTVISRVLTLPMNLRQQRSSLKMQEMQPQVQAIQKKYRDNPQKMQEEFKKINYNPAESVAGCLPMLVTMPIWIGLYRAILYILSSTPQGLFQLSQRAYSGINLTNILPIPTKFLWLNLAQPDPLFVLPLLVFGTMFLQQKLMAPPKKDDDKKKGKDDNPAAAMTQSMQYTMPIMFGFFSLQFQAGLSIYFVLSNIIGIFQGLYTRREMEAYKAAQPKKAKKTIPANNGEASKAEVKNDKALEVAMKGTAAERKQYQPRKRTSKRKKRAK